MEHIEEIGSDYKTNTVTIAYRVSNKYEMKNLLNSMYVSCFNKDIPIENGQDWVFVFDSYTRDILSMCQIVVGKDKYNIRDVCTPSSERGKGYGSILIESIINYVNKKRISIPVVLSILCTRDIYDYGSIDESELEKLIRFYSKLHFKINNNHIKNNSLFIDMIYLGKVGFRLNIDVLIKSNLSTIEDILSFNDVDIVEINNVKYYNFNSILEPLNPSSNKYTNFKKESINSIFKNCLNPSIASFITEKCQKIGLLVPIDEGVDKKLINKHFYLMNYFEDPDKTYLLYMGNVNPIGYDDELEPYEEEKKEEEEKPVVKRKRIKKKEEVEEEKKEEVEEEKKEEEEKPVVKRGRKRAPVSSISIEDEHSINVNKEFEFRGLTLWLISPETSNYHYHITKVISKFTNIILPLALNEDYFKNMLNTLENKGLNYFISKKYKDVCNFNEDIDFKSIIFVKNDKLPNFGDKEPILDVRKTYISRIMGDDRYVISKNEIKRLKSLLNKSVEYGDTYDIASTDNNIKIVYSNRLPIKGTYGGVDPGLSSINFHVHPNYCNSKEKMLVAWPSGNDYSYTAFHSSFFANHIKTHLCVTSSGIFFIKLNKEFVVFLQSLTSGCKDVLYNLINAYFTGTENLRIIKNLNKYKFLKEVDPSYIEAYKISLEEQINDPDTCHKVNQDLFSNIISEYMNETNNVSIKTLLDINNYDVTDKDSRGYILETLKNYIEYILNNFSCEKRMKEEMNKNYSLYITAFAPWDVLLKDSYFEFN
jgi:predicted GNAT family acetyltransferase